MKVKERAIQCLTAALKDNDHDHVNNRGRNLKVAERMRKGGWTSVNHQNLTTVAKDLGFLVIGDVIYDIDE